MRRLRRIAAMGVGKRLALALGLCLGLGLAAERPGRVSAPSPRPRAGNWPASGSCPGAGVRAPRPAGRPGTRASGAAGGLPGRAGRGLVAAPPARRRTGRLDGGRPGRARRPGGRLLQRGHRVESPRLPTPTPCGPRCCSSIARTPSTRWPTATRRSGSPRNDAMAYAIRGQIHSARDGVRQGHRRCYSQVIRLDPGRTPRLRRARRPVRSSQEFERGHRRLQPGASGSIPRRPTPSSAAP